MNKVRDYINTNLNIQDEYRRLFGRSIPTGKMFCPFHHNVNTPAAKAYGNIIKCFSCNKSYTVYDLLMKYDKEKINEIKATFVIESKEEQKQNKDLRKTFDPNRKLKDIVTQIIES